MKKVMLGAAVCAMAFSANADNVTVADELVIVEAARASAFNSIYGGLGIGGSFLKSSPRSAFKDKWNAKDMGDMKNNRFMGSFVLGGGKVFSNNVYVGGEFLADFMKSKSEKFNNENITLKSNGFMPQIAAKLGYVFKNDTLVYGKLGCAWSKAKVEAKKADESLNSSKTSGSVVLGLGAEKAFCKKFSTAVEADYNFGFKSQDVRFNKGWTVRALVKYNVKY